MAEGESLAVSVIPALARAKQPEWELIAWLHSPLDLGQVFGSSQPH